MYTDNSTTQEFPKTLHVRNEVGGLIWQVYHVRNEHEAMMLAYNATNNGFYGISLEDHRPEDKETWPGWRVKADKSVVGHDYVPTEEEIALHEASKS